MLSASMVSTSSIVRAAASSPLSWINPGRHPGDFGPSKLARPTPGGGPYRQIAPAPRSPAPEDRTSIGVTEALPGPPPPGGPPDDLLGGLLEDLPEDLPDGPFPEAHGSNGRCFQPAWFPPPP